MQIKLQKRQEDQQCSYCVPRREQDRNQRLYYDFFATNERQSGMVMHICSKCLRELKQRVEIAINAEQS